MCPTKGYCLGTFTSDSASELDVLGHDCDTFGVDSAQVGVLKKSDQVSFAGFLEGHNGRALESEISLEVLCDFTYKSLEWQFSDQELGTFLVTSDLTKSYCSGPVSVGFLDSTGGWGALTGGLGCQLFSWSLSSCGLSSGLLCSCHLLEVFDWIVITNDTVTSTYTVDEKWIEIPTNHSALFTNGAPSAWPTAEVVLHRVRLRIFRFDICLAKFLDFISCIVTVKLQN